MMWWQEAGVECICPATPPPHPAIPAQATSRTHPTPTPRELTITMATIVWSASPSSQEMPQASPRLSD